METETSSGKIASELAYPFLGQGWSFPPAFTMIDGEASMVAGALDIAQSLTLLLGTFPGERKMHPEYGVDLSPLMFESLTIGLQTRVTDTISRAVLHFEPRIILEEITYDLKAWEGILYIELIYTIQSTNSRTNMVFPYYLLEGTDI